jgi:hypothetical protein
LNRNIARAQAQAAARASDFVLFAAVGNIIDLFNDVKPTGPQDYKNSKSVNYTRGSAAFGNFNYGAVATARGVSSWTILNAASLVQAYEDLSNGKIPTGSDNSDDPPVISAGINYVKLGCNR